MNKFFLFSFTLMFFFNACIADDYSFDELLMFANKGDKVAQFNLGLMYQLGQKVTKDEAKAVKWYIKSAEQGVAEAQYNLGVMYSRGEGLAKDGTEAEKWWIAAANQGFSEAQFNLGILYYFGQGVAKDGPEAERWLIKAAEQDHMLAQIALGALYHDGTSNIPLNGTQAIKWLSKAAAQGSPIAQERLGKIYAKGIETNKNFIKAYTWLSMVKYQSDEENESIESALNYLRKNMEDWHIEKARSLAAECWASDFQECEE